MRASAYVSVAVVVAFAVGAVGCGDDDNGGAPTTRSSGTTSSSTGVPLTTTTTAPSAVVSSYDEPIDLGALPGTTSSASDINNDGVIVGSVFVPVNGEAYDVAVWWPNPRLGPRRIEGDPAGTARDPSWALRVNDRGQALLATSSSGAWVVDLATGAAVEVVVPFASEPSPLFEAGMNNRGDVAGSVVVGTVTDANGQHAVGHAFRWEFATRKATDLGTLWLAESSHAYAINDAGRIVGESGGRAFVWEPDTPAMHELDTRESVAFGVNNHGQAVGNVGGRATMWDLATGELTELGVEARAGAVDINNAGQVLGGAVGTGPSWVREPTTGKVVEVTSLANAAAINDHAQVVGIDNTHGALWGPSGS
jgi:uncharacterized membrane protein